MTERKALAAAPDQPKEVAEGEWHGSLDEAMDADRPGVTYFIDVNITFDAPIRKITFPKEFKI